MVCLSSYLTQEAALLSPARRRSSTALRQSLAQKHTHKAQSKHTDSDLPSHSHLYSHKMNKRDKDTLHTHTHTAKPSGSAMETMHETEGIETVSLLESSNLSAEGHILCSARERASNTASFLMPSGCVCVCVWVFAYLCCHSLGAREKKRLTERLQQRDSFSERWWWTGRGMQCHACWGRGTKGGERRGVSDEGCETVTRPESTWSELCGMCLHHQHCQLTLHAPRAQTLYIVTETP